MQKNDTIPLTERSLADVARTVPEAVAVFEEAGIDFICRGARTLSDGAAAVGYAPAELQAMIEAAPRAPQSADWPERPLADLVQFLAQEHAELAGRIIPALRERLERAASRQPAPGEVRRIAKLFSAFAAAATVHMAHEERDLFSEIVEIEHGSAERKTRLSQRILREFVEHETFRDQLRTMRELGWRSRAKRLDADVLPDLLEFSRRLHFHMHLENNILYPRAIAMGNEPRRPA